MNYLNKQLKEFWDMLYIKYNISSNQHKYLMINHYYHLLDYGQTFIKNIYDINFNDFIYDINDVSKDVEPYYLSESTYDSLVVIVDYFKKHNIDKFYDKYQFNADTEHTIFDMKVNKKNLFYPLLKNDDIKLYYELCIENEQIFKDLLKK